MVPNQPTFCTPEGYGPDEMGSHCRENKNLGLREEEGWQDGRMEPDKISAGDGLGR